MLQINIHMVDQKRYNIHNISKKEKFFGNSLLYIASYQIFLLFSILFYNKRNRICTTH